MKTAHITNTLLIAFAIIIGLAFLSVENIREFLNEHYGDVNYKRVVNTYVILDSLKYSYNEQSIQRINVETFSVTYSEYIKEVQKNQHDQSTKKLDELYKLLHSLRVDTGIIAIDSINFYIPNNGLTRNGSISNENLSDGVVEKDSQRLQN